MANNNIELNIAFHPGETLEEKIKEMNISLSDFAKTSNVPECILTDIINGDASVSTDIAIALENVTEIPARMWIKMQHAYDNYILSQEKETYMERISRLTRRYASVL